MEWKYVEKKGYKTWSLGKYFIEERFENVVVGGKVPVYFLFINGSFQTKYTTLQRAMEDVHRLEGIK